ncbi:MAG: hypothetical protein HRT46_09565 [Deltaproteobacteria bacterium]|nr:hypothetical protein [Deltaproteobacteria bacterium]
MAPAGVAGTARSNSWLSEEPDWLLTQLMSASPGKSSAEGGGDGTDVPALMFSADDDPLVQLAAVPSRAPAKLSATALPGHWWPAVAPQQLADELHRFLVLTLGDRVVDFPDSVFD